MFSYDKAITEASKAFQIAGNLVDKWGFTKQERAENETKRATGYNQFMAVTDSVAQQVRSRTRRTLVLWVVLPYVWGWIATFFCMVASLFYPQASALLVMLQTWLKMYTPIVAVFGGGYIGYYGVQTVMSTIVNNNNNNKKGKKHG